MITTTLGVLVEAQPALLHLAELRLPVKAAYSLAKLLRLTRAEVAHFTEVRDRLIRELGEPLPTAAGEPQMFRVTAANTDTFRQRLDGLFSLPVELPVAPLTLDLFGTAEVAATDLAALGPLLSEPPEA